MRTAVVTGANRGIGSEFVVRLLEDGWRVYAGYRSDMHRLDLIENDNLFCHKLDVSSNDSIKKFADNIDSNIDLLINNAGVPDGRWRNVKEIDDQWMLEVLDINSVGPVRMVKEFYEKYDLAKRLFKDADAILNIPITKMIFEGPSDKLNLTENTQPAIFLASYCIYEIIKKRLTKFKI